MNEPYIQFKNVTKRFKQLKVLDDISFDIERGKITTLIGRSGMGKSVIFKHIIGLLEADSGEIILDGRRLSDIKHRDRRKLKSRMGYLFQNLALFDAMTIFDNIALPLREKTNLSENEIKEKVNDKLEKLEIIDTANKYPSEISGGMNKRVGLARALIMDPEIVLFDEPTTGLDPIRKNAVHSMISHMQKKFNFTAIIISHEIPDVLYISHKILMLDNGKILVDNPPDELEKITNPIVTEFIQGVETLKDDMTGLQNKKAIANKFEETVNQMTTHCKFSLIIFKINALDEINENLGFIFGQKIIQHMANQIGEFLPCSCHNSRYSDDMLVTLLPDAGIEEAQNCLNKFSASIKKCPDLPPQGYKPMQYSVSAGVAEEKRCGTIEDAMTPALKEMNMIGEFTLNSN